MSYSRQWGWIWLSFSRITIVYYTWRYTNWIRSLLKFVAHPLHLLKLRPLTRPIWVNKPCRDGGLMVDNCSPTGPPWQSHSGSGVMFPMIPPPGTPLTPGIIPPLTATPCTMVPPGSSDLRMQTMSAHPQFGMFGKLSPPFWWRSSIGQTNKIVPTRRPAPSGGGPGEGRQESHRLRIIRLQAPGPLAWYPPVSPPPCHLTWTSSRSWNPPPC